jgi:hypothetical protein
MAKINSYEIVLPHIYRIPPSNNLCIVEKGTKIIVDPNCKCVDVSIEE